ncbi:GTPase Era [candidate division KSB1 bacterium]|nr:GTPase Era [candidate division KSB1 bacterium]
MENITLTDYTNYHSGYVALVGQPNVGKSTLMNQLLQIKLSIVTPKAQTTRHQILGILNEPNYQIVFLDTPGLMTPKYKLQELMVKTVHRAVDDADIILFMVEAKDSATAIDRTILDQLIASKKPILLVINKVDAIGKARILPQIDAYRKLHDFADIIPISALNNDGLTVLKEALFNLLPKNPPYYPPDMLTEQPERFFVAELIREKVFQQYGDEIPYSTTVVVDEFKERSGAKDFIRATIFVERLSQKGILIGKKGAALKKVGQTARHSIEHFLEREVYLELHVSVKEKWRDKEGTLRELGY